MLRGISNRHSWKLCRILEAGTGGVVRVSGLRFRESIPRYTRRRVSAYSILFLLFQSEKKCLWLMFPFFLARSTQSVRAEETTAVGLDEASGVFDSSERWSRNESAMSLKVLLRPGTWGDAEKR